MQPRSTTPMPSGSIVTWGAVGSAGLLCEAHDYLKETHPKCTAARDRTLQGHPFNGKQKKSLAYVIAIMNMILHGIEAPMTLRNYKKRPYPIW
jgi:type I restriction enzyme M protein